MKQIKVNGVLVWDDEYFQRGDFVRREPLIDPDEAGDALVAACIRRPERAAALQRAFEEERQPKQVTK
ncbi:MAG: hypothetical protein ACTHMO_05500 [Rhodanobacteraceae bacterium]